MIHAAPAVVANAGPLPRDRAVALAQVLPLCAIAWGALAFGGVYAWAYWPLAGACLLSGALAIYAARDTPVKSVDAPLVLVLTVLAGAILVQLFPLPVRTVSILSPHTADLLHKLNPAFAAGLMRWHAISIWPNDTLVAFVLYASLALLLVGTARVDNGKPPTGPGADRVRRHPGADRNHPEASVHGSNLRALAS